MSPLRLALPLNCAMSFKGHHRVEAMAGMLIQVSSKNRLLLMTDMHNEMKETDKRRFLKFTMKECDEELAQMLFEKLWSDGN